MVVSGERWREEAAQLTIQRPQVWRADNHSGDSEMDLSQAIEKLATADEVELEAIDEEIERLSLRIERLKRVRKVLGGSSPKPKSNGSMKGDWPVLEAKIVAIVKESGPLRPKVIGQRMGVNYTTIGKIANASSKLTRLEDGTIELTEVVHGKR